MQEAKSARSVASNPSVVYAFYLAYAWLATETPVFEASLAADVYRPAFALFVGPDLYVLAMLPVSSLLSFAIPHIANGRAVRSA